MKFSSRSCSHHYRSICEVQAKNKKAKKKQAGGRTRKKVRPIQGDPVTKGCTVRAAVNICMPRGVWKCTPTTKRQEARRLGRPHSPPLGLLAARTRVQSRVATLWEYSSPPKPQSCISRDSSQTNEPAPGFFQRRVFPSRQTKSHTALENDFLMTAHDEEDQSRLITPWLIFSARFLSRESKRERGNFFQEMINTLIREGVYNFLIFIGEAINIKKSHIKSLCMKLFNIYLKKEREKEKEILTWKRITSHMTRFAVNCRRRRAHWRACLQSVVSSHSSNFLLSVVARAV